jgi:hypothetical protein
MRNEGFTIDSFIGDLYCDVTGIVKGVSSGANTLVKFILPITLIGVALIGVNYYQENIKK